MKAAARGPALALALVVAGGGCVGAGTYQPRPSSRIVLLDTSSRVFAREGKRYEVGFFGSGGEALVAGNELALVEVRKYRPRQRTALALLGATLALEAVALYSFSATDHHGLALGLSWAALAPAITAAIFAASANHGLSNAVNIYNDALEGSSAPNAFEPPPPPPGGR